MGISKHDIVLYYACSFIRGFFMARSTKSKRGRIRLTVPLLVLVVGMVVVVVLLFKISGTNPKLLSTAAVNSCEAATISVTGTDAGGEDDLETDGVPLFKNVNGRELLLNGYHDYAHGEACTTIVLRRGQEFSADLYPKDKNGNPDPDGQWKDATILNKYANWKNRVARTATYRLRLSAARNARRMCFLAYSEGWWESEYFKFSCGNGCKLSDGQIPNGGYGYRNLSPVPDRNNPDNSKWDVSYPYELITGDSPRILTGTEVYVCAKFTWSCQFSHQCVPDDKPTPTPT